MIRLRALRFRQWLLLVAFVVAALGSAVFATRFVVQTIYWSTHREEPIERWMPVGYVAHSHGVQPSLLFEVLELPAGQWDRRPIGEIAAKKGVPFDEIKAELEAAIADARRAEGAPSDILSGPEHSK
jgi:hypothetical protein